MMFSQWQYDLTKGQIVSHELLSAHRYSEPFRAFSDSFFDANHSLVAMNSGDFVTACDFKTRATQNLMHIKKLCRLQAEGPVLAVETTNGQIHQVRALARDEVMKIRAIAPNEVMEPTEVDLLMRRTIPKMKILTRSDSASVMSRLVYVEYPIHRPNSRHCPRLNLRQCSQPSRCEDGPLPGRTIRPAF